MAVPLMGEGTEGWLQWDFLAKQAGFEGQQWVTMQAFEEWMTNLEERSCELDSSFQDALMAPRASPRRPLLPPEDMTQ